MSKTIKNTIKHSKLKMQPYVSDYNYVRNEDDATGISKHARKSSVGSVLNKSNVYKSGVTKNNKKKKYVNSKKEVNV